MDADKAAQLLRAGLPTGGKRPFANLDEGPALVSMLKEARAALEGRKGQGGAGVWPEWAARYLAGLEKRRGMKKGGAEMTRVEKLLKARGWRAIGRRAYEALAKGKDHKYIKRVPYTKKNGKRGYKYYYKETLHRLSRLGGNDTIKEGSSFQLKDGAERGHFHVKAIDGDRVTLEHDETGKVEVMTRIKLAARLEEEHGGAQRQARAKANARRADVIRRNYAAAKKEGSAAHMRRWEKEATRHGVPLVSTKSFAQASAEHFGDNDAMGAFRAGVTSHSGGGDVGDLALRLVSALDLAQRGNKNAGAVYVSRSTSGAVTYSDKKPPERKSVVSKRVKVAADMSAMEIADVARSAISKLEKDSEKLRRELDAEDAKLSAQERAERYAKDRDNSWRR